MKARPTIGQRIHAAIIAHNLHITSERALKLYLLGHEENPSWEELGEALLREEGIRVPENLCAALRPQLVPSKPEDSRA